MAPEPPVETPSSLAEALELLASRSFRPIAGGTDLMVQITGELGPPPDRLLDLWRLSELRGIMLERGHLVLGALTTYTEIRRSALCKSLAPGLVEAAATIGAIQIQNRGTLGGNIVNASPAGDTLPFLLVTNAEVVVASREGERRVPAIEFWTGYRRTALRPDELVLRVRTPITGHEVRFRKVGTRRAQAISKVVMAVAWHEDGPLAAEPAGAPASDGGRGSTWRDVRIGLGSVAERPIRAPLTEAVLEGALPSPETADRAAAAIAEEIRPIDDVRSTADYRRAVTARILRRVVREAGGW